MPTSGASRQSHAAAGHPRSSESVSTSSEQIPAVDRDDEAEPDADLRGGDRHHGEREDLARAVVRSGARARSARGCRAFSISSSESSTIERVAADEHAERADPEQERRRARCTRRRSGRPSGRRPLRVVCEPRITPPTAAMSKTTDVISKASRWSARKTRPIQAGRAEVGVRHCSRARGSRSPACRRRR